MRKVELSLKEKQKYEIIKKLVETNGNKEYARIKLGLKSIRQVNRLIAGYKEYGKEFFIHGNRGRKPKHALTDELKDEIETLYTSKYFDCTYTQFTEYLADRENIFLSIPEVGQILRDRHILSPRARKLTRKNLKKNLLKSILELQYFVLFLVEFFCLIFHYCNLIFVRKLKIL